MMNTGEKIDYMIQCLQVAKAEFEYSVDYLANEPERDDESIWECLESAKSFIILQLVKSRQW